ncbi:MAG TPA: SIMPL domain-containing protein, partial [Candidatus Binatia bacterium]|nr:SIMPL domain-containing protein [Candidatus Binatia bacterium]
MTTNNTLPWIVAIAALLVVAFLVYQGGHPGDSGTTLRDTITVSGTAELKVDPDKADLWMTVESTGTDAAAAQSALQLKSNKVIDALKAEGVAEKDMET